ncbi:MAG: hypothetical protein C5B50_07135 [Verrucomicrobia bacterium]|nr:MAG: hypothetical protein C5B50_07135 [Verrucomicrobiota bacterium]
MSLCPEPMHPQPTLRPSLQRLPLVKPTANLAGTLASIAVAMFLAGESHAATASLTPSNAPPPVVGSVAISNIFNAYYSPAHGSDFGVGSNVGSGGTGGGSDGTYTYIADDKAVVGQTFTTGTNAAGYKVLAVTLRAVAYGSTFSWVPSVNYAIRITKPGTNGNNAVNGTNTLTVLAYETAEVGVDWANCSSCNVPSIGDGAGKGAGCGRYITFTLNTPVAALPNTLYGFDIGLNTQTNNTASRHTFYWETDGRGYLPQTGFPAVDLYTNGAAYISGPWNATKGSEQGGHGDNTITNIQGDRCFVVSLNPATVVSPPSFTTQIRAGGNVVTNVPQSGTFYAGETARLFARVAGDTNLVYQWRLNGTNISDGAKFSGTSTATLSVSNVNTGDNGGSFTLVVTNLGGAITSAPPATLTVVAAPAAGTYAYTVFNSHPIAYWRLNDNVNPSTNPPTFDYVGGGVGVWETNALQAAGPRPSAFPGFEANNVGTQSRTNASVLDHSWTTLSPLNLDTNTVTFAAWIFPNGAPGVQNGQYSGFFFTRAGSTECGMEVGDSGTTPSGVGQLAYTWNDGEIRSWPSGFTIPANQWSFIGLVINRTNATVYFGTGGGALASAVNTAWHDVENWSGPWTLGFDPRWAGAPQYVFNGVVDEVAAWNRSLTFNEMTNLYAAAFISSQNTNQPPVITCSSNKTVECGSVWGFDPPSASGGCCSTNSITVTGTITNGSVGAQTITRTWQATDCCSNTASCSQTVTVVDTTPPVITCASNKTVQCGSVWSFDAPSANDTCSGTNVTIIVTGTITNGSVGAQTITRTWQATDSNSNSASCSQTVTVVDTTPPVITCASNKTVQCGSVWSFDAPSASDSCSGTNVTVTVTGTTTNATGCTQTITRTWQATDPSNNTNTCSQTVTVASPNCAPAQITVVSFTGTTFTMSFPSLSCVIYDCQSVTNLTATSWTTFQTVTGTGNPITVQDTLATPAQRFYRVSCRCH